MSSTPTLPHWIDGREHAGVDSLAVPVHNPATGEVVGRVAPVSVADLERALASASAAFEVWSRYSLAKRAAVMFRFRELLAAHTDELAEIITREHGKTLPDARGEVGRGLEVVEFACGLPQLLKGEYSDQAATGIDVYSFRHPLGVVAGITPFNFPVMIPLWMSPVALATGNTFVLKPPTKDPSAANVLADLWRRAGLPDGAFTVLHGDRVVVDALVSHPAVAAVSFVGSSGVARRIHAKATALGKRVQALGAAKNHAIVLADANLEFAADNLVGAAFGAAGERCMALPAVLVEESIADELAAMLVERTRAVRMLPGTHPDADLGPVISPEARDRIVELIGSAEAEGATILVDGRGAVVPGYEDGYWVGPTLIDHVTADMTINKEEVFGPCLEIIRVKDLTAGIAAIQANPYGNGAVIFTGSGEAARTFVRAADTAGMIGVNVPIPVPVAWHSFGGWKESLFGESHMYGPEGVRFFTRGRVVTQRWPASARAGASFHFSGDAQR